MYRSLRFLFLFVSALFLLLSQTFPSMVFAHTVVDQRIQARTNSIEKTEHDGEQDAALYLSRGALQMEKGNWQAAQKDFHVVAAIDPDHPELDYQRGRLLYFTQDYASAVTLFKRFLQKVKGNDVDLSLQVAAHLLIGTIMQEQSAWSRAIHHYDTAIELDSRVNPGYFIARARAIASGDTPDYEHAIAGLDGFLQRSPGVLTVAIYALELELKSGNKNAADIRMSKLKKRYPNLKDGFFQQFILGAESQRNVVDSAMPIKRADFSENL